MRKNCIVFMALLCIVQQAMCQIGIGTTSPDESSILDIESKEKGLLIPRMTEAERDAIVNPAEGLLMYNTTEKEVQINKGTPSDPEWANLGSSSSPGAGVGLVLDCNTYGFEGLYVQGIPFTSSNKFKIQLTNNSFSNVNLAFSTDDLQLSGMSGITVSSVSPTSINLVPGAGQTIEYTLTGTPTALGEMSGVWTKSSLSCSKVVNIGTGDAVFESVNNVEIASIQQGAVDLPGVIDNASNKIVLDVAYTEGVGSYTAYTGEYIANNDGTGENGDVNGFRLTYPGGTLSSGGGTIPVTVEVDGDGSFDLKKQAFAVQQIVASIEFILNGNVRGTVNLAAIGGILDRNYDDANHKFLYLPVAAADGRIWLNNNLGANYANVNHAQFNPAQQATSDLDMHAFGSHFQWGRAADGHELVTYTGTSGVGGTLDNGVIFTTTPFPNPSSNQFLTTNSPPYDWLNPQADNTTTLWQGVNGLNNPCPNGYRLPTAQEFTDLIAAENITNGASAASSALKLTQGEWYNATNSTGEINFGSYPNGYYWTQDVSSGSYYQSSYLQFRINYINVSDIGRRVYGMSVRCIRD